MTYAGFIHVSKGILNFGPSDIKRILGLNSSLTFHNSFISLRFYLVLYNSLGNYETKLSGCYEEFNIHYHYYLLRFLFLAILQLSQ